MPTRLAFCITDLDPGGAERALVQIVTRLDRTRWEPMVFCLAGPGALVERLADADIPVKCLGARRAWNLSVVPQLARHLKGWRPALLQTFLFHANIAGRIAARGAGVRHVVCGIRVAERRSRARLWLDRATEWMVERHVCVSQDVADFSIREGRLSREKTVVIPNGVDADRFAFAEPADLTQFGIPPGSPTILFVGRLDPQKGPDILLEAFARIATREATPHVLFVGTGPMADDLRHSARERRLADQVHFAGWRADVPELMRAATVLALPSRWEGLPNVALEAMAARLPALASRVEGAAELTGHALFVPPDSPGEFAAALEQILAAPEAFSEGAERAQVFVRQRFSWDSVTAAYDELYGRLLGDRT